MRGHRGRLQKHAGGVRFALVGLTYSVSTRPQSQMTLSLPMHSLKITTSNMPPLFPNHGTEIIFSCRTEQVLLCPRNYTPTEQNS